MKYSHKYTLLVLLLITTFGLSNTTAQTVRQKHGTVLRSSQKKAENHTPRTVTDEEYQEALDRLDVYLEKTLNIKTEDIVLYDFQDENKVELAFVPEADRSDTTIVVPDSVNLPGHLFADYSTTLQEIEKQKDTTLLDKGEISQAVVAERRTRQAARQVKNRERNKKHTKKQYSIISIYDSNSNQDSVPNSNFVVYDMEDSNPTTVKTISRSGKNVEITVDGQTYRFENGKPMPDTIRSVNKRSQSISSSKKTRRSSQRNYYYDDDDLNLKTITQKFADYTDKNNFRGHWVGIELGFNWFLSPTGSFHLSGEQTPMRINMGSAINWNINFIQYSIPFGTQHFGAVIGLGTNFNHFRFKAKNTMTTGDDHIIFNTTLQDQGHNVKSSRFFSWSLTAPLLIEFQNRNPYWQRFYVATGILAHLRLHSSTTIIYDKSRKLNESDSFNMHDLSYAATLRIGYGPVRLYTNFYPMGFFESGQGPTVYPIELGIVVLPFI